MRGALEQNERFLTARREEQAARAAREASRRWRPGAQGGQLSFQLRRARLGFGSRRFRRLPGRLGFGPRSSFLLPRRFRRLRAAAGLPRLSGSPLPHPPGG
jgi:hypothetical protein